MSEWLQIQGRGGMSQYSPPLGSQSPHSPPPITHLTSSTSGHTHQVRHSLSHRPEYPLHHSGLPDAQHHSLTPQTNYLAADMFTPYEGSPGEIDLERPHQIQSLTHSAIMKSIAHHHAHHNDSHRHLLTSHSWYTHNLTTHTPSEPQVNTHRSLSRHTPVRI